MAPRTRTAVSRVNLTLATPSVGSEAASTASQAATQSTAQSEPASVEFNSSFLNGTGAAQTDISRFDKGNVALPGRYRAALYVNQVWVGTAEVTLRQLDVPGHPVRPTFDRDLLERIGVDMTRLGDTVLARLGTATGHVDAPLPDLIPQATAAFDMGEQRLDVTVPQAMMSRNARGWVDPKFWDDGVPAAVLQYNANVYHSNGSGFANTQSYLGLTAGANFGAWRFRYNGNVTNSTLGGTHVQSMQTYAQRSFAPIKSQLTVGDSFTDGTIFDSFGVRGVQIGSDDRMYPESQRGYAPTVRGIANTNAKVQVRQNGNIIYETTVPPGPFEINDLYPTGYGGDLQVVVTEADGSQRIASVPYSAPVNALREGRWRYSVSAGQYRNTSVETHPFVFEGGVQRGLNNFVTLYGGTILGEDYVSAAAGVALDTPIGAFGFDVTQANTDLHSLGTRSGQSLRLSYSRTFAPTSTAVTLAAYRYSTSGFLDYQDAMTLRDLALHGTAFTNNGIQKGRLQLTLNQYLGKYGSVYASGYTQNYWNKTGRDTAFQLGYNTNVGRVGVGVSASRELDANTARWDNRIMLNLSIPLNIGSTAANTQTSFTHDSNDNSSQIQETFSGAAGKDFDVNYGVTAGRTWGSTSGNSLNANVGYLTRWSQLRANAGYANGYTQAGFGATGSIVGYEGGLVLSPQTGDTYAVIEAKDAAGARISTSPGVRLNGRGQAAVAGMLPYSLNNVEIDTKGLPLGVQLKTTEQHFAPTAGSVVRLKFDTEDRGRAVLMRVRRLNSDAVPFGADVLDAGGNLVGSVSQGSRAMFYMKTPEGQFRIKWGDGNTQSCTVRYALPKDMKAARGTAAATVFADAVCE
ncbi:fimbria/pilus outer membrane usher protein [Paraburkholderia sp. LEh10]|uniref:fimbria/pilus outer membrane usher protein n=1 Tax=Paraburkholderia sp. LEh10 TaxID=2821353 RepID=UPI001FD79B60|nr:fimbria/pilus outer membrane usher protein [Paraburkholderia sp. LEh10]